MKCEKHNHEFDPLKLEGCPECIAEAVDRYLVKARFCSSSNDEMTGREYTYWSEEALDVDDVLKAPGANGGTKIKITAVDVDEAEIEAFLDKVKVIPAGSVLQVIVDADLPPGGLAEAARAAGAEVNVVKMVEPEQEEMEAGLNAEGLTLVEQEPLSDDEEARIMAGADIPVVGDLIVEVTSMAIAPWADTAVQSLIDEAKRFLEYADGRVVNSPTSEKYASEDLILIRNTKKAIEAKRKEYLDPVNAKATEIRDFFKQLQDPIQEADKLTSTKMLAYGAEVTRQREEAERIEADAMKLAKEQEALTGEHTVSLEEVPKPEPEKKRVRSDIGVVSKVDHWKWQTIDLKLIPREYLVPDEAMLNSIAKKHHDAKQIPGISFYNEPHMAARSG